jgi:hypothetical protein
VALKDASFHVLRFPLSVPVHHNFIRLSVTIIILVTPDMISKYYDISNSQKCVSTYRLCLNPEDNANSRSVFAA